MIRPLRRFHRASAVLLLVVLPAAVAAGLLARQPIPREPLPASLLSSALEPPAPAEPGRTARVAGLHTKLVLEAWPGPAGTLLEIAALEDPRQPELCVYLAPGRSAPGAESGLPDSRSESELLRDSRLLGTLAGTRPLRARIPAEREDGRLVLYSLGRAEIVDVFPLPDFRTLPRTRRGPR